MIIRNSSSKGKYYVRYYSPYFHLVLLLPIPNSFVFIDFQLKSSAKWCHDIVKISAPLCSRSFSKIKISIGHNSMQISASCLNLEACELQIITKVVRWVLFLSCKIHNKDKQLKYLCFNNNSSNSSFCSLKQQ